MKRVPKLERAERREVAERAVYRFVAGQHAAGGTGDPVGKLAFARGDRGCDTGDREAHRQRLPDRELARFGRHVVQARSPAPGQLSDDGNARGRRNDDELRQAFFAPPTGERFLQAADDEATQTCGRNREAAAASPGAQQTLVGTRREHALYAEPGRDRSRIDRERNAAPPGFPQRAVAGIAREQERRRLERLLNEAGQGVIGHERESGDQRLIGGRARHQRALERQRRISGPHEQAGLLGAVTERAVAPGAGHRSSQMVSTTGIVGALMAPPQ